MFGEGGPERWSCRWPGPPRAGLLRSRGDLRGVGMAELPTGTVTFLFTDLEGSTRLWEERPEGMHAALARHDEIVREAIEGHGGAVVKMTGDGAHAAFALAHAAIVAAVDAQLALGDERWEAT